MYLLFIHFYYEVAKNISRIKEKTRKKQKIKLSFFFSSNKNTNTQIFYFKNIFLSFYNLTN